MLIIGLLAFGLLAIQDLLPVVRALFSRDFANELGNAIVDAGLVRNVNGLLWYLARQVLEGPRRCVAHQRRGLAARQSRTARTTGLHRAGLLSIDCESPGVVLHQFTTILLTVLQFGLLLALMRYRQRYLTTIMHHQ